jgi:elongation factor P
LKTKFEQYAIDDSAMDDAKGYLVEQDMCVVTLWNDRTRVTA